MTLTANSRARSGTIRYRGNVRHIFGEIKGPTTGGAPLLAVAATYDRTSDRTTVGFVPCPPEIADAAIRDDDGTWRRAEVSA